MGENMNKLQDDRLFLQSVYSCVKDEIYQNGTIETLKTSVMDYEEEKQCMEEGIMRYSYIILV